MVCSRSALCFVKANVNLTRKRQTVFGRSKSERAFRVRKASCLVWYIKASAAMSQPTGNLLSDIVFLRDFIVFCVNIVKADMDRFIRHDYFSRSYDFAS